MKLTVSNVILEGLKKVADRHGHTLQYELDEALLFYLDVIDVMDADGTPVTRGHNHAAALLGQLGGRKGGNARAAKLSPERRTEIARKAAQARWGVRDD